LDFIKIKPPHIKSPQLWAVRNHSPSSSDGKWLRSGDLMVGGE